VLEQSTLERAVGWIDQAQSILVLTGAGISTDSGIPEVTSTGVV